MFGVYITHPQVLIDPAVPVPSWGLSETGAARAGKAARLAWVRRLCRIVSSEEAKAVETAHIFGRAAGIEPEILPGFHENDRSATGFLPPEAFEAAAAVDGVLAGHDPRQPIAFVGHGGVGTLLKCRLKGIAITRVEDQGPGGGGNLFPFSLSDRAILCDWTPIETWQGWTGQ